MHLQSERGSWVEAISGNRGRKRSLRLRRALGLGGLRNVMAQRRRLWRPRHYLAGPVLALHPGRSWVGFVPPHGALDGVGHLGSGLLGSPGLTGGQKGAKQG